MGRNAYLGSWIKLSSPCCMVGAEIPGGELGRPKLFIMWGEGDGERENMRRDRDRMSPLKAQ